MSRGFGCRHGAPHDIHFVLENNKVKVERCHLCNKVFRWNKRANGRTDNVKYLEAHIRNFCQPGGKTRRVFHKLYKPKLCIITI